MRKKTWIVTMRVVDTPEDGEELLTDTEILDNVTKVSLCAGLDIVSSAATEEQQ